MRFTEIVNQPWDVALNKVLAANGLQAVEDSTSIITVDSYAPAFVVGAGLAIMTVLSVLVLCPEIKPLKPKSA